MITDQLSAYEKGLTQLLEELGKNHLLYTDVLTYQSRLLENISQARQYGDTETRRADRAQILGMLNRLALDTTGQSFNEWCNVSQQGMSGNFRKMGSIEFGSKRIQIILEGEYSEFDQTRQKDLVNMLAAILEVESNSIRILQVHSGSVVVILEMPAIAASRLQTLVINHDFRLRSYRIISVKIENEPMLTLQSKRETPMKKTRIVFVFVLSAFLTLIVGLLSNLVATYLAPTWADKPWIVYVALAATFIISLAISSYLFLKTLPETESNVQPDLQPLSPSLDQPSSMRLQTSISQLPGKSYRELIGRDILIGDVLAALRDPAGKWIVAVDGMGGIGKTALAREIADRCTSEHLFDAIVWDQAPKESQGLPIGKGRGKGTLTFETVLDSIARQLGALDVPPLKGPEKEIRIKGLLQVRRVLIILDNLETAKESQDEIVRRLLPKLNPSKALMTSRHRFQGDVYAVHLPGLDEDGALRFIRQEAQEKNIQNVSSAGMSELKQIAETTGGSPLALKLVVGQLGHLPLGTVLEQLRKVKLPKGDSDKNDYIRFYKGIFSPSWRLLSDDGKKLLISMSHFAPGIGGTYEAVKATSDLADDILNHCIDELWRLSFLERGESPSLKKVRYYLHALTQYFVLSDIVKVI